MLFFSQFVAVLAIGVKESSRMNNLFTGINLCVVTFIIIAGSIKADFKNWNLTKEDVSFMNYFYFILNK
jgi:amino acid transporter